jgi:hypothetical protein
MYISQVGSGIINNYPLNQKETKYSNNLSFKNASEQEKKKFNLNVFGVTTITTFLPLMLLTLKRKKHPPIPPKSRLGELMHEVKDLGIMATGSIGGGLASGLWFDRNKNKDPWIKIKEANYQFISNNLTPVLCQAFLMAGIDKHLIGKDKINELKHNIELNSQKKPIPIKKWQLYINKVNGYRMLGGLGGIVSGLLIGSKITNILNNKIIKKGEKYDRKIEPHDFVIQMDNVFAAMALLKIPYVKEVIMPFLSVISGYQAGTK